MEIEISVNPLADITDTVKGYKTITIIYKSASVPIVLNDEVQLFDNTPANLAEGQNTLKAIHHGKSFVVIKAMLK